MNITGAIHDKLAADATLDALISTYDGGSPPDPAIFTGWPVPEDATRPYVFTRGYVSAISWDELSGAPGLSVLRDVTVIADNTGSDSDIETIATRVRELLHRQKSTISDGVHVMTQCVDGPVVAETDDSLTGRRLTFRITATET